MPENTPLPITNGFYLSDSRAISAQQCINWYPNIVSSPALSQETLFGTAGAVQVNSTGVLNQQNRGSEKMNGIAYFVNGTSLVRLNVDETIDTLGTIEGIGRVSMATNGTQLVILVPGGKGSVFVEDGDVFTPDINAVDSDFTANGQPQHAEFINGFFVFTTDSKKFISSAINDALSYNALDFGTAEADPDDIVAPIVHKNQLFLLGSEICEVFDSVDAGAGFSFQRVEGFIMEKGLFSPFSVIKGDSTFRFVGGGKDESPGIYEFRGSDFVKISNTAIDAVLQDLTSDQVSNIFAMHYGFNGQFFTTFTMLGETFEYNSISQRWHQRRSFIGGALDAWRVASIVTAYGKLYIGDRIDGRIGVLDEDVFTEYDGTIFRLVDTMPFAANGNSFTVSSMEMTVESGVGDFVTVNPLMRMSRSLDSKKFTDELTKPMGKIGEFDKRMIWRRLGRARRWEMFRYIMTAPVKPVIIKLTARFKGGSR